MKKNEKGFGAIETLLILIVVGLIGFTGWYVLSQNHSSSTKTGPSTPQTNPQTKLPIKNSSTITITLTSKASGKPIAYTKVSISSSNGTLCIGEGCNTNNKSWTGTTDKNGVVTVPKDYIQTVTTVTPEGYSQASLRYDPAKTSYELVIEP